MSYIIEEENYLSHEGVLRRSGRYPWGSGEDPYQRVKNFNDTRKKLINQGHTETEIAEMFGFKNSQELREWRMLADAEQTSIETTRCRMYRDKGWSTEKIAEKLGITEPTVRNRLKPEADRKAQKVKLAIDTLKAQIDEKKYLDVSAGVENAMGVSPNIKNAALRALKSEGYSVVLYKQRNAGRNNLTDVLVAIPPGLTWKDVHANRFDIKPFSGSVEDNKVTPNGWVKPLAVDPKRVAVRYGGEGGEKDDGTIYIRRGVEDLSMGKNHYAQVRIQVGDGHYLKGMAVYKDDLPDGADIVFNTNKPRSKGKLGVMKELNRKPDGSVDEDNPFGSTIRKQIKTEDGKKAKSALNIVNVEGDEGMTGWDTWSKNLPAQFLSKQSTPLAKTQLELTRAQKQADFDEIMSLSNPTVKKKLLQTFSDEADASAEHLKAAALPGQKTHVILPINSLKDNEVFAPNFKNGDRLVLIRFPHAGAFEIPEVVVNNKNKEGLSTIGLKAKAAIGINHNVAERLSGADFDGDTVIAIPNNSGRIMSRKPLPGLVGYDPKDTYGPPLDFDKKKVLSGEQKAPYPLLPKKSVGLEMGMITNLVTDMQILGANDDEVARAVRHSMTIIDAEKHSLDYKRSERENGIKELKAKYQGGSNKGASTIISRASSETPVNDRRERTWKHDGAGPIDPVTGKKVYVETGVKAKRLNKETGEWEEHPTKLKQIKSTKMRETDDAHKLTSGSGSDMEAAYADHANAMKALANKARVEMLKTPNLTYSPEAKKKYQSEVDSLDAQLRIAMANAPKERQAQRLATQLVKMAIDDDPSLKTRERRDDLSKIEGRAILNARERVGAKKQLIIPTEKEWEAIQAGAISNKKLQDILNNSDMNRIKQLAMPRENGKLSTAQVSLISSLRAAGYTSGEIAERLGVSATTVNNYL